MFKNRDMNRLSEVLAQTLARTASGPVYLVGGTVRDLLLKRDCQDMDIALCGDPFRVAKAFARDIEGSFIVLHEAFPTARVVKSLSSEDTPYPSATPPQARRTCVFDFTALHNNNLHSDLLRRDFTINAMAIAFGKDMNTLIDFTTGREDLEKGLIRMVARDNLAQDPLRMLRAFRFAAELGFSITGDTLQAVASLAPSLTGSAAERIWYELKKTLQCTSSYPCLELMADTGLLFTLLPELKELRHTTQSPPHHLDVFHHTMLAYKEAEEILAHPHRYFPFAGFLQDYLDSSPSQKALIKLSVLFHDLGKPATRAVTPSGRITFYGHEKVSREMVESLCTREKTSARESAFLAGMAFHHLAIQRIADQRTAGQKRGHRGHARRAMVRLLKKISEDFYGLAVLGCADLLAKQEAKGRVDGFLAAMTEMETFYRTEYLPRSLAPRYITGKDVMALFSVSPGPFLGRVLAEVESKTLEGRVNSREQALDAARMFLARESRRQQTPPLKQTAKKKPREQTQKQPEAKEARLHV